MVNDEPTMKEILVQEGKKEFKITVPANARLTFGPWSPQTSEHKYTSDRALVGTLRIYKGGSRATEDILAVSSGVTGFRDTSIDYAEKVAVEEASVIWKSDQKGYQREEKITRKNEWVTPELDSGDE